MVSDPVLQWVLTLAFTATAAYALLRLIVDRQPLLTVGNALHLVMSAAMVAMCWPWWTVVPSIPQLIVFASGAAWFAALTVLQSSRRVSHAALGGHSAWHQVSHAIMMLAMTWMVIVTPSGSTPAEDTHHHGGLDLWASLSGVAITAALLTSGVIFLVEFVLSLRGHRTWLGHTGDVASGAAMSLGMAAMSLPMITG
ncbi:DUF5134 domain-containing protein [Microbacterium sp. M]|uniref:DUF5134 domain-containing protein n=1 Tax=Microbacterium sp. M TaxID=3377125 RepID=UPI003869612B